MTAPAPRPLSRRDIDRSVRVLRRAIAACEAAGEYPTIPHILAGHPPEVTVHLVAQEIGP